MLMQKIINVTDTDTNENIIINVITTDTNTNYYQYH